MAVEASVRSEDVVTLLATVPERVTDLVAALEPPELEYRHAPAFPTLQELVGHLCQAGAEVDALLRRAYLDGQRELRVRAAIDPIAARRAKQSARACRYGRCALLVPDKSLQEDQGGRYLLVLNKDDLVEQRYVRLGELVGAPMR